MATAGLLCTITPGTSSAAPSCPVGAAAIDDPMRCVVEFSLTGAPQTFTVPAGVTSIDAVMKGGDGGAPVHNFPTIETYGPGGWTGDRIAVAPGETFTLIVGGAAGGGEVQLGSGSFVVHGGYGGGGDTCAFQLPDDDPLAPGQSYGGGAGGGGTFLFDQNEQLVAAAGGGGGGYRDFELSYGVGQDGGGNGDGQGTFGDPSHSVHGQGGRQDGPGAGTGGPFGNDPRWTGVRGANGTGPALLLNGDIAGVRGGDATCGGGNPFDPATAHSSNLSYFGAGAGGGGYYGGGAGGANTVLRGTNEDVPVDTRAGGGGGGSGIIKRGTELTLDRTGGRAEGIDGKIFIYYRLPQAPTSTTTIASPATTSTTPAATSTTGSAGGPSSTAPSPTPTPPTTGSPAPTVVQGRELARTGSSTGPFAQLGAGLLALGAAVLWLRRRALPS